MEVSIDTWILTLTDIHLDVPESSRAVTRILIKDMDPGLLHPGPGRVLAELRPPNWILRGKTGSEEKPMNMS